VANGDITSPEKALEVLQRTGADAIMIGRAAQGQPWIFREIAHYLKTGEHLVNPETKLKRIDVKLDNESLEKFPVEKSGDTLHVILPAAAPSDGP
jgi:tRNA-dihydrouridine synthase B